MLTKPAQPQLLAQVAPPPDDAIATFTRLIPDAPNDSVKGDLYSRLGEAYRLKGDFPRAINAMEQAAALLPDNAAVFTKLGAHLRCAGQLPAGPP